MSLSAPLLTNPPLLIFTVTLLVNALDISPLSLGADWPWFRMLRRHLSCPWDGQRLNALSLVPLMDDT
ncbi:hypothetical protein, partial [Escherichia coli]|uniref:hypothetical protein n=1 Tax=Escherichia coli TaxID=562 RepID=UPI001BDB9F6A